MEVTTWTMYRWSYETWEAMLRAIDSAEQSIDFEQYYFFDLSEGQIGRTFLETFKKKALQGLRVRLLFDATGSFSVYRSSLVKELQDASVQIEFHKTVPRKHAGHFFQSFLRDHRRLLIIDEKIGMVGGTAIKEAAKDWRETHVAFEGPIVEGLVKAFEVVWHNVSTRRRFKIGQPIIIPDRFVILPNGPLPKHRFVSKYILEGIRQAEKSIYISTPYFVPTHRIFRALRLAARRGVDVRILVPLNQDIQVVGIIAASFFDAAFKDGCRIYKYGPEFLHSKTMTIDEDWGTVGSCNFDRLSFNYDYELNVLGYDPKFVNEIKDHFFDDLTRSIEILPSEWGTRPWWMKVLEKLSIIIRPFA